MAMNMKSMESAPTDSGAETIEGGSRNRYGYGLEINLNDKQLKALGLTKPLPAGTIVKIEAKGLVESARESVESRVGGDGDNVDVYMSVQITDMALEEEGPATDPASILYTNS